VLTVYGHQAEAAVGFNPGKRGRPASRPLLCFDGVTRDVWAGSLHPGNTHVATVIRPPLEEAWAKLPPGEYELSARAAGGAAVATASGRVWPGVALYYVVLGFNLAVTAWIGEWALAGVGLALHAAITVTIGVQQA